VRKREVVAIVAARGGTNLRFISHDPHFVRRWALARGLVPILGPGGALALSPAGQTGDVSPLSWEEFAGLFTVERLVLAYDGTTGPGAWSLRRGLRRTFR